MARAAAKALEKVAVSTGQALNPRSKSPVAGAAAGLSRSATAMVTVKMAEAMHRNPSQEIHPSFSMVRMEATVATMKYAIKPKTTLHAPWCVTALKAIDRPKLLTPAYMENIRL